MVIRNLWSSHKFKTLIGIAAVVGPIRRGTGRSCRTSPGERLVTSIAMVCPFEPNEKQALLEAPDLDERARLLTAIIEMAALNPPGDRAAPRH